MNLKQLIEETHSPFEATEIYERLCNEKYFSLNTDTEAVTYLQLANEMIRQGNYAEAMAHVEPVKDDARAHNTYGVALMMQGKFEDAMPWFEKAREFNCEKAAANMQAIQLEYEFEEQQRKAREEFLKRYE